MLTLGFGPNLNCILCITQIHVLSHKDWVQTRGLTCRKLTKTVGRFLGFRAGGVPVTLPPRPIYR
jgi:hypothetical protein